MLNFQGTVYIKNGFCLKITIRGGSILSVNPGSVLIINQQPQKNEVTFAEISIPANNSSNSQSHNENVTINPVAVIKTANISIALSPDISDHLLSRIIQEVAHA